MAGALPNGISQQDYYEDDANQGLHGSYQYTTLTNIINNFLLMYVGDDKTINNITKDIVLFHAKRGLQEFNYDVLKRIKAIEIDLSDTLTLILPEDYINYVRISWIDEAGNFHPLLKNEDTRIAQSYLQDSEFNLLFDEEGNVLQSNKNSYDETNLPQNTSRRDNFRHFTFCADGHDYGLGYYPEEYAGRRFGLDTAKANYNGWFTIDKPNGVIKFSSNLQNRTLVIEYVSDGLEYSSPDDIRVHKFAEQALYRYIAWMILDTKINMQEYVVRRARKEYDVERRRAKLRLNGISFDDIAQVMRGKDKRLKL